MLDRICDELLRAIEAEDADGALDAMRRLWEAVENGTSTGTSTVLASDTLTRILARLCPAIGEIPPGLGAHLATLGGALVEEGASPGPLVDPVVSGLCDSLEASARFAAAWRAVTDRDLPEPDRHDKAVIAAANRLSGRTRLLRRFKPLPSALPPARALHLSVAWATAEDWSLPATTLLQQSAAIRADLAGRERLRTAVSALVAVVGLREDLRCLTGLLAVLDDEPLIVLHRESGRGYRVTIGGIGDNFQLHTLLAHVLTGPSADGLLEGVRPPDPEWVAAATAGALEPVSGRIEGRFNLVDAYGEWIWNEGVPADIPLLDGHRVVVLDPPPYQRVWNIGRTYPMMRPQVHLDRILPSEETSSWLSQIAPARTPSSGPGRTVS
ncbi:hypothetical protein [Sphaerimonospora thailandensis]|uniref:Uncharacterized protein n=1 Tax=Sphaerimonospora thailandensis TaxID=795644 RepID=A0A8J3W2K4_9ACTN|nr:hypothetical protein [Sphaerimonospora thailandensis]GIH72901.1 hypothetical protein Mth01_51540 [Sphaerimonospora thailandensis]